MFEIVLPNCLCGERSKYEGAPQNWNYFLEGSHLLVQASPASECSRNPSVAVDQLALLWEAVCLQLIFFEGSFTTFDHFMMGDLQAHLPTPCWVFSSFWPKKTWPWCLTLPMHLILPIATFFCFPSWKKSSKRNILPMRKR